MKKKWMKRGEGPGWRRAWPGAVAAVVLGGCFLIYPIGSRLCDMSYDLGFRFRPTITVDQAVIVYMDERSHEALSQDRWQRWDRSLHARLLERMRRAGAKVVVFDVLFQSITNQAVGDRELIAAAAAHGKVVAAAKYSPVLHELERIGSQLATPFPALTDVAAWGVVEVGGEDASVRQHYRTFVAEAPTLSWKAAELALGRPLDDPFLPRWVNYYGPPGSIPWRSFADVLKFSDAELVSTFSNKVVFVGAKWDIGFSGGKGTDDFRTPYTRVTDRKSPGVEINATVCLNLLRSDWLTRCPPLAEFILLLLLGAIFGFWLGRCRPLTATALAAGGALIVSAASILLMWRTLLWFPWLIVVAVQIPVALGWSILAQTRRLIQDKRGLQQQLALATAGAPTQEEAEGPAPAPPSAPALSGSEPAKEKGGPGVGGRGVIPIPNYTMLRQIGEGAYGEVWLARDLIGSHHAVKIVYRRNFANSAPFEREFRGITRFTPISRSHPGLVNILHVGRHDDPDGLYYIMELGDDEETGQRIDPAAYSPKTLAKEIKKKKKIPLGDCLQIGLQLADALQFLHSQQLIHRDIKPTNVIFVNGSAKLADIGLVTEIASRSKGVTYIGTQGYIPPEGPGTPAADIYSLGRVMYEAAFGLNQERFPELPTALMEGTDDALLELDGIILHACENDLRKRYPSAADLRTDLLRLQEKLRGGF